MIKKQPSESVTKEPVDIDYDHLQPYWYEDAVSVHGTHTVQRGLGRGGTGFRILSRDGWIYDSDHLDAFALRTRMSSVTRRIVERRLLRGE